MQKRKFKKASTIVLDPQNLITLKNDDSSKSRNLGAAKYFFTKFAKSKSRENN